MVVCMNLGTAVLRDGRPPFSFVEIIFNIIYIVEYKINHKKTAEAVSRWLLATLRLIGTATSGLLILHCLQPGIQYSRQLIATVFLQLNEGPAESG